MKFKVKKINNEYVVGKDISNGYGTKTFTLPTRGKAIYQTREAAQRRADKLNK